jgi:drug/metabolite transporter (DMT)-like permease
MNEVLGLLAPILSSALGGTAVVATRWASASLEPLTLATLRYAIGAVCLLPLAIGAVRRFRDGWEVTTAVGLALLFFALFPFLFTLSLSHTTAARGSLALTSLPLFTYALACMLGSEAASGRKLLGIGVAMAGVGLGLAGRLEGGSIAGDLIMLAAAMVGAAYNVLARPLLQRVGALRFTAFGLAVGASALVAADGGLGAAATLSTTQWLGVAYLGVVGCALTFVLWSIGLQYAPPALVALTVTVNPVSSALFGSVLLGEAFTPQMAAGLVLVMVGLALASGVLPWRWAVPSNAEAQAASRSSRKAASRDAAPEGVRPR